MDLLQKIEGRRFLGREFLAWLWYESEACEGQLTATDTGPFELFLEKQITLEAGKKDKEQSKLRGMQPSVSPEAREALRQGKLPTTAQLRLRRGEQDWVFLFSADPLSLSGVKIPALLKDKEDEPFYERIGLIEDLEALVDALYGDFLALRVTQAWSSLVMPAMMRWIREEEATPLEPYVKARQAAVAAARGKTRRAKAAPGQASAQPDA